MFGSVGEDRVSFADGNTNIAVQVLNHNSLGNSNIVNRRLNRLNT